MKSSETTDKIIPALITAQTSAKAVPKSGENKFHHYSYASLEDYASVVDPLLPANGLALVLSTESVNDLPVTKDSHRVNVSTVARLYHTSGQWIEVESRGEGLDSGDKATYKAITGSRKYLLALLFNLITTDDPESDSSTDAPAPVARVKKQSAPPSQPGEMIIDSVKTIQSKPGAAKPWTGYILKTNDGVEIATFDKNMGEEAQMASRNGTPCLLIYHLTEKGKYQLDEIHPAAAAPASKASHYDDLPF